MQIRRFKADEETIWQDFWSAYNEDFQFLINGPLMKENWRKILSAESPIEAFWLQDRGGDPAGFVHFTQHDSTKHVYGGRYYIEDLFVYPKHRRKGYAKALVQAVLQQARDKDIQKVHWITRASNKKAQALYDQFAKKTDWIRYEMDISESGTL